MSAIIPPRGAENLVELRRFNDQPLFDPWEEFQVPDFPLEVLPPVVAQFVRGTSDLIGCDPNGLAMAAIVSMGAALDHRFGLKIMRHGDWWASPRMWLLLCGNPSRKKTPAINAATSELENVQGEAYEEWRKEVEEQKLAEVPEEQWACRPPRHVVTDTTTEKLAEILSRQDRGVLVKRDELSGWIGSMEKYAGRGAAAADRGFWLQAYDGGRFLVDRIKGERHVRNLSASIIGGIQPGLLAEMKDQTTDGLLQRFVPIVLKAARFPVDQSSGDVDAGFRRLIRHLLALEPANLIMDDAGVEKMEAIRRHIFDVEQASGGLAGGFQGFAGKLPVVAASIALILHLADDSTHGREQRVGANTVEDVDRLVRGFLLPHALEFYRGIETVTDGDRLRKVASWILTSGKERIVPSDLAQNVAGFRGLGISEINQRLSPLVAVGWLTPEDNHPFARAWKVAPAVRTQMADRTRIEEDRKIVLAEIMNSRRRKSAPSDAQNPSRSSSF